MLPLLAPLVLSLAPTASAWWWDDTDDFTRSERIAAIVISVCVGTALISYAFYWATCRRRREVAAEFAMFRPPPPPGVVGYDVSDLSLHTSLSLVLSLAAARLGSHFACPVDCLRLPIETWLKTWLKWRERIRVARGKARCASWVGNYELTPRHLMAPIPLPSSITGTEGTALLPPMGSRPRRQLTRRTASRRLPARGVLGRATRASTTARTSWITAPSSAVPIVCRLYP